MKPTFHHLEKVRLAGFTQPGDHFGAFQIPFLVKKKPYGSLMIIASDGSDLKPGEPAWEHVSVHVQLMDGSMDTPTWQLMCMVKDAFWNPDECVMQLHVPKTDHINTHPHTLHLWKPVGVEIPRPPREYV